VKVAFLSDGLDINNPDFIRADGSHVFIDYQDFIGNGTTAPTSGAEGFTDASALAAQGRQVYDLSTYVHPSHPLPAGCTIRVRGVAPDASLVGLIALGPDEVGSASGILQAIDYAVSVDHVDVLNDGDELIGIPYSYTVG
jgi:hypothetical protein